ncbi:MAG: anhydro-N-acetylmuramic acid kinase, partial [Brevibacterium aurantiacum]|nr:anhydro-N-acetylmuramic acid kinase [Brevibacterium aurantiacum]
ELIVSHGQTVRHDITEGAVTSTLQIRQPAWIAEATGAPVLSDVRARDVAAGGQGAPLVGILDSLLVGDVEAPIAVLNLGGIANITVLAPERAPLAFDTGPANALIDILARRITKGEAGFDRDGELAARGRVDEELLEQLLADPYYQLPAPKSTGKELFHADYLDGFLEPRTHLGEHDAIATVTALTARTVADACHAHGVTTVIASGGGTRNPTLLGRMASELGPGITLTSTDQAFGLPEGAKEALLMALLGWLSWNGLAGTEPNLTGAAHSSIAGRLSPGRGPLNLPEPLEARPTRLRILDR